MGFIRPSIWGCALVPGGRKIAVAHVVSCGRRTNSEVPYEEPPVLTKNTPSLTNQVV